VTIVKMNIVNQTKDARSVIVRHTLKDLFGMNAADEYTINLFLISQLLDTLNSSLWESIISICTYIIYVSWKGYQKGTGKD
jgi:hypothetical protein